MRFSTSTAFACGLLALAMLTARAQTNRDVSLPGPAPSPAAMPAPAPTAAAVPQQRLTLAQAYALAVARSEALGMAAGEWRAAEARYRQAVAAHWPELGGQGSAEWRNAQGESQSDAIYRAGLGATYTIFSGLRITREAEAREAEAEAFDFDVAWLHQLLYQDVSDVFYQVLADAGQLAALQAQIDALAKLAGDLEERIGLGRSRRAELLAAETQAANVRIALEETRGAQAAARELLAFLTGMPADTLALADETALPAADDVDRYLAQAESRPDVQAAAKRVEAAQAEVKVAQADRNVEVTADGNLYVVADPGDPGDWDLTLRAELPLFDRGLRRAAVAEQVADARVSELSLSAARRSAARDVRTAYVVALSALAQWAALQDAVRLGESNVALQQRDYELGRTSNLDVLSALVQLHNLRGREAVLTMQAKAALVRLHVAAGGMPP